MTRLPLLLLLLQVLPLLLTCLVRAEFIYGAAFSTGHDTWGYRQQHSDKSLNNLKSTGANYVQISVYARMPVYTSLTSKQVTDDDSIRYIVRKIKSKKLKVFLKPVVETSRWRGFLVGPPVWFREVYIPFITHMAQLAQDENVELFSIGSEYRDSLPQLKQWHKVINTVRNIYKGPITYIANHDSYQRVHFWNRLDYISLSAYFRMLPGDRGPSLDLNDTKAEWTKIADRVDRWRKWSNLTRKNVIIAEFGAQSKGDGVAYRVPWNWTIEAPVDFNEQTKMYEGMCNAFMSKPWVVGILFWVWELQPHAGTYEPGRSGYTPQNKPAQAVMSKCFSILQAPLSKPLRAPFGAPLRAPLRAPFRAPARSRTRARAIPPRARAIPPRASGPLAGSRSAPRVAPIFIIRATTPCALQSHSQHACT